MNQYRAILALQGADAVWQAMLERSRVRVVALAPRARIQIPASHKQIKKNYLKQTPQHEDEMSRGYQ